MTNVEAMMADLKDRLSELRDDLDAVDTLPFGNVPRHLDLMVLKHRGIDALVEGLEAALAVEAITETDEQPVNLFDAVHAGQVAS